MSKIMDILLPLVAEKSPKGHRLSLGRFPLFIVTVIMAYRYAVLGEAPQEGILVFLGMAYGYNGTKWFNSSAPKVDGAAPQVEAVQEEMK